MENILWTFLIDSSYWKDLIEISFEYENSNKKKSRVVPGRNHFNQWLLEVLHMFKSSVCTEKMAFLWLIKWNRGRDIDCKGIGLNFFCLVRSPHEPQQANMSNALSIWVSQYELHRLLVLQKTDTKICWDIPSDCCDKIKEFPFDHILQCSFFALSPSFHQFYDWICFIFYFSPWFMKGKDNPKTIRNIDIQGWLFYWKI